MASLAGVAAFAYPFLLPVIEPTAEERIRAGDAPLFFALITVLSLAAILSTLQEGHQEGQLQQAAKSTALLGVLVAVDATLRLVPTFLGASPIFPLILLTGAVFGGAMGFQMGALTLLVSAFLTGGVGPWLPFQMMTAGWVGLSAGLLPRFASQRVRFWSLLALGAFWGFAYGAIMNLWTWPFAAPGLREDAGLYWNPSLGAAESLGRYAQYYLVTSAGYDVFRAIANFVILLAIGPAVMQTLERFRRRFTWTRWTAFDTPETKAEAR
ncbi:MAG: ECF transporter S component [Thermomicrobiales bacterium]